MKLFFVMIFFVSFVPIKADAGWLDKILGYDSFEDCLLGELSGNEKKTAALLKRQACQKNSR